MPVTKTRRQRSAAPVIATPLKAKPKKHDPTSAARSQRISKREGKGKRTSLGDYEVGATPPSARKKNRRALVVKEPVVELTRVQVPVSVADIREAQVRLHVSAVPDSLPCREEEFAEIFTFTESKLRARTSGCMYISGVPGTGKTATIKEVLRTLEADTSLPPFNTVEINGMRLTEPSQAYVQIWKQLNGGAKVTAAHAQDLLSARFSRKNSKSTVLMVDELDMLWNKKQSILYNLFDWPTKASSKLVVLAIANTMDLPEKMMMNRVASRLGLTRKQFSPYTHEQLQMIVAARLEGLKIFDPDAVNLVSRKVASLSGDARRALDICRRATELAQQDSSRSLVGMSHVVKAHEEMFQSSRIMALRSCSKYEKTFLRGIVDCFRRSGTEETTMDDVLPAFASFATHNKLKPLNVSESYHLCMGLAACRLILAEPGSLGPHMRIWLNVSQEDVNFALAQDDQMISA